MLYFEYTDIDTIKNFGVPEHIAQVDADRLYPLTLRRWREGDSFRAVRHDGAQESERFF